MNNGVRLTTPQRSSTNGYVERNLSNVNLKSFDDFSSQDTKSQSIIKKPNKDILEHERKRKIELKCVELEDLMEKQGYKIEEIEAKVNLYRESLIEKYNEQKKIDRDVSKDKLLKNSGNRITGKVTHEELLANALKDQKFKESLKITSDDEKNTDDIFDRSSKFVIKRKLAEEEEEADEPDDKKPKKKKSKKNKRSKKKKCKKYLYVLSINNSTSDDDDAEKKHENKVKKHRKKDEIKQKSRSKSKSENSKESGQISESLSSRRNSQEKKDELKRIMDYKMKQAWKDDNIKNDEEYTKKDRSLKKDDSSMRGGTLEKVICGYDRQKYGESNRYDYLRRVESKDHGQKRHERDVPRSSERALKNVNIRGDKIDMYSDVSRESRCIMSHRENEDKRYMNMKNESRREWREELRRDDRYRSQNDNRRREKVRDYRYRSPNNVRQDGRGREEKIQINNRSISKEDMPRVRDAGERSQTLAYRDYGQHRNRIHLDSHDSRGRRDGRSISYDDKGLRLLDIMVERRGRDNEGSRGCVDSKVSDFRRLSEKYGYDGLMGSEVLGREWNVDRSVCDKAVVKEDLVQLRSVVIADTKKDDIRRKGVDLSSSSFCTSVSSVSSSSSATTKNSR